MNTLRFTVADAEAASDAWRFNCGPGALCAALDHTPATIRPYLGDFESKGYTNPTLMYQVLMRCGATFKTIYRADELPTGPLPFPDLGLMRVQWAGPWTRPGVPIRARYRETHWVAVRRREGEVQVFDVNCMSAGGWLGYGCWACEVVPWLLRECCPKATGAWWPTHIIELR